MVSFIFGLLTSSYVLLGSLGLTESNTVAYIESKIVFPRQSLKRVTFCVKSSDSIFYLSGLSPIIN